MDVYTKNDPAVLPLDGELTGKILVLNPTMLKEEYRSKKYQLWKAEGGFGCKAHAMGTCVTSTCVADGEVCRWERGDFIGIYNGTK